MLDVYLIDYYKKNNSGLSTYVNQLTFYLNQDDKIRLHSILVRADICKTTQQVSNQKGNTYYVPFDIGLTMYEENIREIVDALSESVGESQYAIFHFNWINHVPFSKFLKKHFHCYTILTKHCIPWRDLITSDYRIFKYLNETFTSKQNYKYPERRLQKEEFSYNSVDRIICVTEFAKKSLKHFFEIPEDKLGVVYNGLDLHIARTNDINSTRIHHGFKENEIIILYAGSITQRKGIFDLINIFDQIANKIENIRLVVAGTGDFNQAFSCIKNNWAKITFTGGIDKKRLYDLYRIADIGIVPSYVEQCSYTAIEMMRHGLPLIITNTDGLAEIVPDYCSLKVPLILGNKHAHIDTSQLGNCIIELAQSPKKRKELGHRAKQYSSKSFTAQNMFSSILEEYNSLIAHVNTLTQKDDRPKYHGLVSIILPCYNGEKYLKLCIESVLAQTYPYFELIIINDGSEDSTKDIIEQFEDSKIVLIDNVVNLGLVESLNIGIEKAKGKYIARIDSDDLMHKDRILKQIDFLEKKENEDIGILGSYHYIIDGAGRIIGSKPYPSTVDDINSFSFFQNPFSHPSVTIRAHILKKIKYSKDFAYAEDYDLWFRILKHYKGINLKEHLTYYRIHDKNISVQNIQLQRENVANLLSVELEKKGIEHSISELSLHMAIYFGYREKFFNEYAKIKALNAWIMKVLSSLQNQSNYSDRYILDTFNHIKRIYCDLY